MSKPKPQYLVSTDSIGFLGRSEQFTHLWKEYFDNKTLDGVEAIAFKPLSRLNKLVSKLEKNKIKVLSFHGKTGKENFSNFLPSIVMPVVNYCIADVCTLFNYFPKIEFLSHNPYFKEDSVKQTIIKHHPRKIWIENNLYGKKGADETIKLIITYRENNINAHGMLDIYHYIANSTKILKTSWPKLVDELELYFLLKDKNGMNLFTGIHFPIGSRLDDSLPIDDITDDMLELFAQKIIPHVERVVFENQQKDLGLFFSTNSMILEQKKRNKRIIKRLKKTGIIC